jgi:hypothetical protein
MLQMNIELTSLEISQNIRGVSGEDRDQVLSVFGARPQAAEYLPERVAISLCLLCVGLNQFCDAEVRAELMCGCFPHGQHSDQHRDLGRQVDFAFLYELTEENVVGYDVAGLVKPRMRYVGIGQVLTMPVFFANNAIHPTAMMENCLKVVSQLTPLTYIVDSLQTRILANGPSLFVPTADYVILLVAATIVVLVGAPRSETYKGSLMPRAPSGETGRRDLASDVRRSGHIDRGSLRWATGGRLGRSRIGQRLSFSNLIVRLAAVRGCTWITKVQRTGLRQDEHAYMLLTVNANRMSRVENCKDKSAGVPA